MNFRTKTVLTFGGLTLKNEMGMWIGLGLIFGAAFGVIINNSGLGIGLGLAIGVAIGASKENKNKK